MQILKDFEKIEILRLGWRVGARRISGSDSSLFSNIFRINSTNFRLEITSFRKSARIETRLIRSL